jgi:hypothetical protein
MSQVEKKAGTTAWTGSWRAPYGRYGTSDHRNAVRAQRRRDRRELRKEIDSARSR